MAKCVVCAATGLDTYVDESKAQEMRLTAEYQGRTYYFDSEDHKRIFEQDPQRYLEMAREKGWAA